MFWLMKTKHAWVKAFKSTMANSAMTLNVFIGLEWVLCKGDTGIPPVWQLTWLLVPLNQLILGPHRQTTTLTFIPVVFSKIHSSIHRMHGFGGGWKMENLEGTHADMRRTVPGHQWESVVGQWLVNQTLTLKQNFSLSSGFVNILYNKSTECRFISTIHSLLPIEWWQSMCHIAINTHDKNIALCGLSLSRHTCLSCAQKDRAPPSPRSPPFWRMASVAGWELAGEQSVTESSRPWKLPAAGTMRQRWITAMSTPAAFGWDQHTTYSPPCVTSAGPRPSKITNLASVTSH